ncbi:hypothetical protein O9929_20160 [Vibrio lentus]|nr:hypothetical protein [Vibrio lentus]
MHVVTANLPGDNDLLATSLKPNFRQAAAANDWPGFTEYIKKKRFWTAYAAISYDKRNKVKPTTFLMFKPMRRQSFRLESSRTYQVKCRGV